MQQFGSLADALQRIGQEREDYDIVRPHSSLGDLSPREYVTQRREQGIDEAA